MLDIVPVCHVEVWHNVTTREVSAAIDHGERVPVEFGATFEPMMAAFEEFAASGRVLVTLNDSVYAALQVDEWWVEN